MAKRLVSTIALAIFGVSAALTACGDDPASQDDSGSGGASAGEAGSNHGAGTKTGGSAAGGTKAGNGGNGNDDGGGEAGIGGALTGAGGEPTAGGSDPGAGGTPDAGGAGGAGDALTYACNSTTISHQLCSALVAASCPEPTDCPDCVAEKNLDREAFGSCPACGDQYDAFLRCGIDAFESGNLSNGIECVAGFGADLKNDACGVHLNETLACEGHAEEFGCPLTWPVQ